VAHAYGAVAIAISMCVYGTGKMSNCSKLDGLQSAVTMRPSSWDTLVYRLASTCWAEQWAVQPKLLAVSDIIIVFLNKYKDARVDFNDPGQIITLFFSLIYSLLFTPPTSTHCFVVIFPSLHTLSTTT